MVTADVAEALGLLEGGADVVLILDPEATAPAIEDGTGRLAVMVGDPSDPAVQSAAREMDEELFNSRR